MSSVFSRNQAVMAGTFSADSATLALSGGVPTVLVQSLQAGFSQSTSTLYDMGSEPGKVRMYRVGGRALGQGSISRVLGPAGLMSRFYRQFGDVCLAAQNNIVMNYQLNCGNTAAGASGGGFNSGSFQMKFCTLKAITVGVDVNSMLFQETSSLEFGDMDFTG